MTDHENPEHGHPLLPLLDSLDVARVRELLADQPELASTDFGRIPGHSLGAMPLNYVAMLRFDTQGGRWRDVPGTGALAQALLDAGAPLEGRPDDSETPLITAASYGDAEVAEVLIKAGANLEAMSSEDAGGIPSASPLTHAAIFGMTDVVDALVNAGARVTSVALAAAAGDISTWSLADISADARLLALIMAADHQRLAVIDELVAAGTPIDAADPQWQRQALRLAASGGRARSVRHLLALGANPDLRDDEGRTALDLCRAERGQLPDSSAAGFDEVDRLLSGRSA